MRVNISVSFEVVEEIDATDRSVDLADLNAAGMGPEEAAAAVKATIEDDARKGRAPRSARKIPALDDGHDYGMGEGVT